METRKNRLLYIDNIRWVMIAFVVLLHLAVTYSGSGSWYYKDGKPIGFIAQTLFGFTQTLTFGYFMGLLFLAASYFVPSAYDRKGFGKFMADRLVRLGIPTLLFMLAINPFTEYVLVGNHSPAEPFLAWYAGYIGRLDFISGSGPLWFALALLVFTFVYGLGRFVLSKLKLGIPAPKLNAGLKGAAMLALLISALSFLVRTVQPMGTSVLNMQLCNFAQYIVLFAVGILAYRQGWLSRLDYGMGMRLLRWALTYGFAIWGAIMLLGESLKDMTPYNGGFTWQSAAFSLWESFSAVAMDIGILVLFREKFNGQGKLAAALSLCAFAVYVFHTPIIVAITMYFRPVQWLPGFKFLTMAVVCLPVCFGVAHLLKKTPLLKKIL